MATKKSIQKSNKLMKITAKSINDNALELTENLVEGTLATGAKWQKLMSKVMNGGTELFEKQQDLTLTALEGIKDQVITSNKRFIKLFGFDIPAIKKTAKKEIAKVEKTVKATATKATKKVRKVAKDVEVVAANAETDIIKKDNLKLIEGVGPKIAGLLNQAGITTFAQVAASNIKDLQTILDAAGPRFKSHDPKTWRVQAKRLMTK